MTFCFQLGSVCFLNLKQLNETISMRAQGTNNEIMNRSITRVATAMLEIAVGIPVFFCKIEYTMSSFSEEIEKAGLKVICREIRWGDIWAECL
jgi:hypothetical protein